MNISTTAIEEAKTAYLHQSGKRPQILCVHTDELTDLYTQFGIGEGKILMDICGLEVWPHNPDPGHWRVTHAWRPM
jgi:hypothetical protein